MLDQLRHISSGAQETTEHVKMVSNSFRHTYLLYFFDKKLYFSVTNQHCVMHNVYCIRQIHCCELNKTSVQEECIEDVLL